MQMPCWGRVENKQRDGEKSAACTMSWWMWMLLLLLLFCCSRFYGACENYLYVLGGTAAA